ncbi:MAG: hypothetical protein H0X36_12415, partial [Sphingomonadaceae bacterium]|nr:hypothetical protein [Sphingomonadaceae bacterium]
MRKAAPSRGWHRAFGMTASAPPTVGFRLPHPELRPYVTSYYFADSAGPLHD